MKKYKFEFPAVGEALELARKGDVLRQVTRTPNNENLLFPRISPQKRSSVQKRKTKSDYTSEIPRPAPIDRRKSPMGSISPPPMKGGRLYTPSAVVRAQSSLDYVSAGADQIAIASPWGKPLSSLRAAAEYEIKTILSAKPSPVLSSKRRTKRMLQPMSLSSPLPISIFTPDPTEVTSTARSRGSVSSTVTVEQRHDLKTGDDVIAYFARYGEEARRKFIYLVRQEPKDPAAAYELVVVPPEAITGLIHAAGPADVSGGYADAGGIFGDMSTAGARAGYYTMSASGVVSVAPGEPSEVVSMEEWIREKSSFTFLRRIRFFKFFRLLKFFRGWNKYARRRVFKQARANLKGKLLQMRSRFAMRIVQARSAVVGFKAAALMRPVVEILRQRPVGVEEFKEKADAAAKVAGTVLNHYMERIQSILSDTWIDILRAQQQNAPAGTKGPEKGLTKRFDSLTKAAHLSKHTGTSVTAIAREMVEKEAEAAAMWAEAVKDRESFPNFIRLLDAMVVESLLEWAADECKEYADVLWRGSSDDTEGGVRVLRGLFMCSVHLTGLSESDAEQVASNEIADIDLGSVAISPSTSILQLSAVEDVIERLRMTVESVPRLLFMPPCLKFFSRTPQAPPLRAMLAAHEPLTTALDLAAEAVNRDFARMAEVERYLEPYMRIVASFARWSPEHYRAEKLSNASSDPEKGLLPTYHSLGSDLNRLRNDMSLVDRLRVSTPLGCLHVEARALKAALSSRLSFIMEKVKILLLELSSKECSEASAATRAASEALGRKAATRTNDAFGFLEQMREAEAVNKLMIIKARAIDFGFHLMDTFHVKVPTPDRVHHDTLHESLERIAERLEMCERWLDTQRAHLAKAIDTHLNSCAEDALLFTAEAASLDDPSLEVEEALSRLDSLSERAVSLRKTLELGISRRKLLGGARGGGAAEENVRGLELQVEGGKTRWALFSAVSDILSELSCKTIHSAARLSYIDEISTRVKELEQVLSLSDSAEISKATSQIVGNIVTALNFLSNLPSAEEKSRRETVLADLVPLDESEDALRQDKLVTHLLSNIDALPALSLELVQRAKQSEMQPRSPGVGEEARSD
uniref:Dynein heavy chain n=1 Tax=Palpitomonas bilix TaxID=652834 RepID=A0A7S3G870_9EUKA|mmetsp:Transcript_34653/g.89892  ORF Transcript_34653/g.89892 Transcript_34653/m.89892 type:complete len:1093 (+) Transcript_34653:265-3543(+)